MTKDHTKDYGRITVYLKPELWERVMAHAESKDLAASSWLITLMEQDMGISFGMRRQKPKGSRKQSK
jgi:hypothetical protein